MSDSLQNGNRTTIAVLGIGSMGAPIARNPLAARFAASVWNCTTANGRANGNVSPIGRVDTVLEGIVAESSAAT